MKQIFKLIFLLLYIATITQATSFETRDSKQKPNAPSKLKVKDIKAYTAILTWKDNAHNEKGYKIYSHNAFKGVKIVKANTTSYTLTGLKPHTNYQYSVQAYNDTGKSHNVFVSFKTHKQGKACISRDVLRQMIKDNKDVTKVNTSCITDMSELFIIHHSIAGKIPLNTTFNQDISAWDVSNVTNMQEMFWYAVAFDRNISSWDVSNVTNMSDMFAGAQSFNQPLYWDVSNVSNMSGMFRGTEAFDGNISDWDVSNVSNMSGMFRGAVAFDGNISDWDVSNVSNMELMFLETKNFNQPLYWDVSNVTNMSGMFARTKSFNQPLNWDVSNVTNMSGMFLQAEAFNGNISGWNVSNVTNMNSMFHSANHFNQPLAKWDVLHVEDMRTMFFKAKQFHYSLSHWHAYTVDTHYPHFYANFAAYSPLSKCKDYACYPTFHE